MKGMAEQIIICGKQIRLGDYIEVQYKGGGKVKGEIIELWSPELSEGYLQARVGSGWCFHDKDFITKFISKENL